MNSWDAFNQPEPENNAWGAFYPPERAVPPPFISSQQPGYASLFFLRVALWLMRSGAVVFGKPGSGKTILFALLIFSVARLFMKRVSFEWGGKAQDVTDLKIGQAKARAIFFDAKGDMPQILAGVGITDETANIYDLDPFRQGSWAWAICRDVVSDGDIVQFVKRIIQDEPHASAPFFALSAQNLLRAAVVALIEITNGKWTLRQLILCLRTLERLTALISQSKRALKIAQAHLEDKKHRDAIMATLQAKITGSGLDVLAALWASTPDDRQFSIKLFIEEPGVVILNNDPRYAAITDTLSSLFFVYLSQVLLSPAAPEVPHKSHPHTWFFLDEMRGLNDGGAINDFANRGRSKGCALIIGLQSFEGLCAKYRKLGMSEHDAEELIGSLGSIAFLKCSQRTAEWAEKFFGTRRIVEETTGASSSENGRSTSSNYSLNERSIFTASSFSHQGSIETHGFRLVSSVAGQIRETYRDFGAVISKVPKPDQKYARAQRDRADQMLREMSTGEEAFFCPGPTKKTNHTFTFKKTNRRPSDENQ